MLAAVNDGVYVLSRLCCVLTGVVPRTKISTPRLRSCRADASTASSDLLSVMMSRTLGNPVLAPLAAVKVFFSRKSRAPPGTRSGTKVWFQQLDLSEEHVHPPWPPPQQERVAQQSVTLAPPTCPGVSPPVADGVDGPQQGAWAQVRVQTKLGPGVGAVLNHGHVGSILPDLKGPDRSRQEAEDVLKVGPPNAAGAVHQEHQVCHSTRRAFWEMVRSSRRRDEDEAKQLAKTPLQLCISISISQGRTEETHRLTVTAPGSWTKLCRWTPLKEQNTVMRLENKNTRLFKKDRAKGQS